MGRIWSSPLPDFGLSGMATTVYRIVSRWLEFDLSSLYQCFRWWPDSLFDLSVIDSVVWSFVMAVESVALISMLCFFFLFCGCNI